MDWRRLRLQNRLTQVLMSSLESTPSTVAEGIVVPRRTSRIRPSQLRRRGAMTSGDGRLSFRLVARAGALHVERESVTVQGRRSVLSLRFDDATSFVAWLEDDPARFAYPLLWKGVMKEGLELLGRSAARDDVA
jgi:hypothetical protein